MPLLGKDAVCIYLWLMMTKKGGAFTLSDAVSYGGVPEDDIKRALAELVTAGVIVRKEGDNFEFVDIIRAEVDEYINSRTDSNGTPVMSSDEEKRNLLASSINKTYYQGCMTYHFYKLIDKCLYEYHFEDNVVYSLFEEGQKERVHYKVSVMYDLAQKWYEKGYTTTESLKDFFEYRDRKDGVEALVKKKLSIKRNLRESELNSINSWIDILGADEAIVEYAIACLEWRDNIRISDIGNKIKEWFDAGVMSIDKAMLYEKERERENKAKSGSTRSRGRANLRKTGREAGITAASASSGEAKTEPAKEEAKEETKEEPKEEVKPAAAPVHDSILDMFSGDDDEDDI